MALNLERAVSSGKFACRAGLSVESEWQRFQPGSSEPSAPTSDPMAKNAVLIWLQSGLACDISLPQFAAPLQLVTLARYGKDRPLGLGLVVMRIEMNGLPSFLHRYLFLKHINCA